MCHMRGDILKGQGGLWEEVRGSARDSQSGEGFRSPPWNPWMSNARVRSRSGHCSARQVTVRRWLGIAFQDLEDLQGFLPLPHPTGIVYQGDGS